MEVSAELVVMEAAAELEVMGEAPTILLPPTEQEQEIQEAAVVLEEEAEAAEMLGIQVK